MVIRCERCSTLYELEDALLAPEGSSVQCTRCDHVFTAHPPRPAGRTLVGVPAPFDADVALPGLPTPIPEPARPDVSMREPARAPTPAPAASPPLAQPYPAASRTPAPEPRAPRAPAVFRPTPGPGMLRAGPVMGRSAFGAFESRLRWSARVRWLAPAAAAALLALAAGAWVLLRGHVDPEAAGARAEGIALVALDDTDSLDQALTRFDDALRRAPRLRAAAADRALAQLLRATALLEDGEAIAARFASRSAERELLAREQPTGWEDAERTAAAEMQALEAEARALDERARALSQSAVTALRPLQADLGDDPAVVRALATYHAVSGRRDEALRTVRTARDAGRTDAWLELVDASLDAGRPEREARERALAALAALSARHPELLRARYLLARAQAALGRTAEAQATLDGLLAANSRHEGARKLREALAAPVVAAAPDTTAHPEPGARPGAARQKESAGHPAALARKDFVPRVLPATPAVIPAVVPAVVPAGASLSAPRPATQGALAPASIPELAPASGAPQIAPAFHPDEPRARPSPAVDGGEPTGGG